MVYFYSEAKLTSYTEKETDYKQTSYSMSSITKFSARNICCSGKRQNNNTFRQQTFLFPMFCLRTVSSYSSYNKSASNYFSQTCAC